jgi:S1-C subfamily serine protease
LNKQPVFAYSYEMGKIRPSGYGLKLLDEVLKMLQKRLITLILAVSLLISSAAFAFDRESPIVKAYQHTKNAVVNISGKRIVSVSGWFDWSDPFGDMFGARPQQEVTILGSGVVVHEDGYVVTNAHVVEGTEKIKVSFSDGNEAPARVISADTDRDIAFLKIEADRKFSFVHLGRSDDLMIGETVIAIGNPFGYANTVTSGVVSAIGRDVQVSQGVWLRGLIQTDAPINRGNSGGPLLNINGELIGITTAIMSPSGGSIGIGFAIPVDTIADNLSRMLMPEKLRRVQLGLVIGRMKTVGSVHGLAVDSVIKNSPADKQGIRAGDVISKIDGKKLTSFLDFYIKMIDKQVGQPIAIEYIKDGQESKGVKVAHLEMLARPLPDGKKLVRDFFQMDVSVLDTVTAQKFGFEKAYPVLIVVGTDENGTADDAGISSGDLILAINNISVGNLKELALAMEKVSEQDTVQFKILRIGRRGPMQIQRQYTVELKAGPKKIKTPSRLGPKSRV